MGTETLTLTVGCADAAIDLTGWINPAFDADSLGDELPNPTPLLDEIENASRRVRSV